MVPDIAVVFKLDNRQLTCAYRKLPMQAWSELKAATSFTPKTLMDAVGDWDLDAIGALVWLEKKQRQRKLGWHEVRQELMDGDHDFELVDLIVNGRSTTGADSEPDEDPTTGSS